MSLGLTVPRIESEHATYVDANTNDQYSKNDVCSRRQPERVPVQRRVTVCRFTKYRSEVVIRRIDPVIACTRASLLDN